MFEETQERKVGKSSVVMMTEWIRLNDPLPREGIQTLVWWVDIPTQRVVHIIDNPTQRVVHIIGAQGGGVEGRWGEKKIFLFLKWSFERQKKWVNYVGLIPCF